MVREPFIHGDSFLHRLDPRVKLIAAVILSTVLAVAHENVVLLVGFGFSIFLALAARLPVRPMLRRLLGLNIFVLFVWLIVPFTSPGTSRFDLGPLHATQEGLKLAWDISIKSNSILILLTALLATSAIHNLAHAMAHLRIPQKLVQIFYFTWRYLHEIGGEFNRLQQAMKIRCFTPRTNLHTYRSYGYLFSSLLLRSLDRAERVYDAMLLRGFTGVIPAYNHPVLRSLDLVAGASIILFAIALGVFEWMPISL